MIAASKKGLNYDRPWRDAMSKKPPKGSMNRNDSFMSLQAKAGGRSPMPLEPYGPGAGSNRSIQYEGKPNTDVRITSKRFKNNSVVDGQYSERGEPHSLRKPRYANDYLSQMRLKREQEEQ